MSFRSQAEDAAQAVSETLGTSPDADQMKTTADIIERAIIASYSDAAERCAKVAIDCCPQDRDMAHKIADEIRRANTALIANLSSLR